MNNNNVVAVPSCPIRRQHYPHLLLEGQQLLQQDPSPSYHHHLLLNKKGNRGTMPCNANQGEDACSPVVQKAPASTISPTPLIPQQQVPKQDSSSRPALQATTRPKELLLASSSTARDSYPTMRGRAVPVLRNTSGPPGTTCHQRRIIFPTYHNRRRYCSLPVIPKKEVLASPAPAVVEISGTKPFLETTLSSLTASPSLPSSNTTTAGEHRRPKPMQLGVNHEYRNHLLSFLEPEVVAAAVKQKGGSRQSVDDSVLGTKRSSILPVLPFVFSDVDWDPNKRSASHPVNKKSDAAFTCTAKTTPNSNQRGRLVMPPFTGTRTSPRATTPTPQAADRRTLKIEEPATITLPPSCPRRIVSVSPNNITCPSGRYIPIPNANIPEQQPKTPMTTTAKATTALKPILRKESRYTTQSEPATAAMPTAIIKKPEGSNSVPSLVDIKDDTDDEESQSSSDHDANSSSPLENTATTKVAAVVVVSSPTEPSPPEVLSSSPVPVSPMPQKELLAIATPTTADSSTAPQDESAPDDDTACSYERKIKFDPRVWIREFHRAPEEASCTWYTNDDMDDFKRLALDRILRYQNHTEIIATGTGRTIQRALPKWNGPIYTHTALSLDGENDGDSYMRKVVLEKELHSILIVDPQDVCLKLFAASFKRALPPSATIQTAARGRDVVKMLEQGLRFDVLIIEERLELFHRHGSSSSTSTTSSSSSADDVKTTPLDSLEKHDPVRSGYPDSSAPSSGAALIAALCRHYPVVSTSLFIGVSAHLKDDESKLQKSGADFCWTKPPPPIDQELVETLAKTILIKRGKKVLATELFG